MPTTNEDVEALQSSVQKKRKKLEEVRRSRISKEQGVTNDIVAAQLKAEEAQLDREIAAEQEASKVSTLRDGASATLEAAKEAMTTAVEGAKADEQLVAADKDAPKTDDKKEQ